MADSEGKNSEDKRASIDVKVKEKSPHITKVRVLSWVVMTSGFHLIYWAFNPFSLVTIPYASYMIIYLRNDEELPAFYMLYGIYILVMGLSSYFLQVLFASRQ